MDYKQARTSILDKANISQDGKNWLTLAIDPYHDYSVQACGYPDGRVSNSYVLAQKSSLDLKSPTGLAWDCNITLMPQMMHHYKNAGAGGGFYAGVSATGMVTYENKREDLEGGQLVIHTVTNGLPTWNPTNESFAGAVASSALPANNDGLEEGGARVVAIAFEVHNTSTPLERGGSVCCYRQPSGLTRETHLVRDTLIPNNVEVVAETLIEAYMPPRDLEAASRIPNSKIWEAKDGCYCVGTLGVDANDISPPQFGRFLLVGDADNVSPAVIYHLDSNGERVAFAPTSLDMVGAYFTGLSKEATLRVNLVRYLEVSPVTTSLTISAALRAADYDPVALETYY